MPHLVVTFLALLELAREQLVAITQAEPYAPIYVQLTGSPGFVLKLTRVDRSAAGIARTTGT